MVILKKIDFHENPKQLTNSSFVRFSHKASDANRVNSTLFTLYDDSKSF